MKPGDRQRRRRAPSVAPLNPGACDVAPRHFGRDALLAYAIVYLSVAYKVGGWQAKATLGKLCKILTMLRFEPGEPGATTASNGYSTTTDVLWLRPYEALYASADLEGDPDYGKLHLELNPNRSLDKKLRRFLRRDQLRDWKTTALALGSLPENLAAVTSDQVKLAVAAALQAGAQGPMPFQGYLVVGHHAEREPSVFRIGVRSREWLAKATYEERWPWLASSPDLVAPLLQDVGSVDRWYWPCSVPRVGRFVERERAFGSMGRALLSWHDNPVPNPWYWRRRKPDVALLPYVEEFRFGTGAQLACFLPYTDDPARVIGDLHTALVAAQQDGVLTHRTTVVVVCSLSLRAAECAIAEVAAGDPGLCGNVRFLVVDGPTIEALGRRYPWIWELAFAAINQEPTPLCSPPSLYEETQVRTLAARGHKAAALAALRSVLALPRLEAPSADIYAMVHDLVHLLGPDACWDIPREAARALKGEWRRARRARGPHDAEHSELSPGSLTTSALLTAAQSDGWAKVPQQGSVQWWGFVRLLRLWRSAGADSVASAFANRVRAMLRDGAFSTDVVDTAWRESRPARPASSADRDVTPD